MLTAQALTLDAMFTEYGRRAMANLGDYPDAVERYTNLASKAQAQCRTTIETLARVKRGGKQTVKVVHVHEGAQAVVTDTFNHGGAGSGGGGEFKTDVPPHGQGTRRAALPGPNEAGYGMPLPCDARKEAVPASRGKVDGGAERQS